MDEEDFAGTIEFLYDGAAFPELWETVGEKLG